MDIKELSCMTYRMDCCILLSGEMIDLSRLHCTRVKERNVLLNLLKMTRITITTTHPLKSVLYDFSSATSSAKADLTLLSMVMAGFHFQHLDSIL